ncbi:MAG TPA: type II toxin-antitoxin system VapC family toxin [Candidatus Acidoferrum sp.]
MNRFVLDTSLAAAWFISDPEAAYALTVRNKFEAGWAAIVPVIWPTEMASVLVKAVRRGTLTESAAASALQQLEVLILSGPRIAIESHFQPVSKAFAVAQKHQVSAYDGLYLELALNEGLPLATLDKPLRAAALKAGVELVQ